MHAHGDSIRLDLRKIEDLVDHFEKVLPARKNGFELVSLIFGLSVASQKELRITQDTVERGAQLVAHIREKNALRAIGGFGCLLRFEQSLLAFAQFGGLDLDG